jgi:hypothetical protein
MVGDFLWFVLLGEGLAKWYFVVWEGGNLFLVVNLRFGSS